MGATCASPSEPRPPQTSWLQRNGTPSARDEPHRRGKRDSAALIQQQRGPPKGPRCVNQVHQWLRMTIGRYKYFG